MNFKACAPFLLLVSAVLCLAISVGCSKPAQKTYTDGDNSGSGHVASGGGGTSSASQLVTIPVSLVDKRSSRFSLAANEASAYSISLEGCATRLSGTATKASEVLNVYKFDHGCLAKLTTFEYGGRTYVPTVDDPFTTWAAGEAAIFDEAGEPGTNALKVKIISTLQDPVSGSEAVVYQFSVVTAGATEDLVEADVGVAADITVEEHLPLNFTIHSVSYLGVSAGGAGQFAFTLECGVVISADTCDGVDMSTITYKLVEDTFTADTLTPAEAFALFPTGETAVVMPGDREAAGGTTTNGGFVTPMIDGPTEMANHRHMIFIMQTEGMAYKYFNVDVAELTQN